MPLQHSRPIILKNRKAIWKDIFNLARREHGRNEVRVRVLTLPSCDQNLYSIVLNVQSTLLDGVRKGKENLSFCLDDSAGVIIRKKKLRM